VVNIGYQLWKLIRRNPIVGHVRRDDLGSEAQQFIMIHEFAPDLSIVWCLRHRADLGQGVDYAPQIALHIVPNAPKTAIHEGKPPRRAGCGSHQQLAECYRHR
jgi:hypothetical protein